jgi:uncharacterized protein YjbI with pentapeptide repeats
MANAEHLEKIREGTEEWNQWRRQSGVAPDLIGADLSNRSLTRMDFSDALLDGADFRRSDLREACLKNVSALSADFSGADVSAADLSYSKLQGSSFLGTILARVTATHADLTNAEISNCDMSYSECRAVRLDRAKLTNVSLSGALLDDASLIETVLKDCQLRGSHVASADLTDTRLLSCNLDEAILSCTIFYRTRFFACSLRNARLDGVRIEDAEFSDIETSGIDLSSAVLIRPSLELLNLSTATLFDTRIIDPVWPLKSVQATLLGAPVLASSLFSHPIQDVKGLSPKIRRKIGDAQLIREYWEQSSGSRSRRLILRLWGITCNYGQSMARWTAFTACVLFAFALALTTVPFYIPQYEEISRANKPIASHEGTQQTSENTGVELLTTESNREVSQHIEMSKPTFFRAFCFSTAMFTTLGFSEMAPANNLGRALVVVLVLAGYVMLGALISILANKLARLS